MNTKREHVGCPKINPLVLGLGQARIQRYGRINSLPDGISKTFGYLGIAGFAKYSISAPYLRDAILLEMARTNNILYEKEILVL